MKKTLLKSLALATVGVLCLAGSAMALPTLRITDGVNTFTARDLDEDGLRLLNRFDFGDWEISLNAGFTDPAIGSTFLPRLDLLSGATSDGSPSELTITWLDNTLGPVSPSVMNFLTSIGGTTDGTVTFQSFYSLSPVVINDFDDMTELSSLLTFTGNPFSGSEVNANPFSNQSPITLAIVANIRHDGANLNQITTFDGFVGVPEPGALLAFGTGMIGLLGIVAVRRKEDQE